MARSPRTASACRSAYNTGNVTRQTIAQILQANFADIDPKYTIEIIGLPWPSFLAGIRGSRLPLYISGWAEDIHDPHNWAQPFLVGTYAARQDLPEEMVAEFQELVSAGVSAADRRRACCDLPAGDADGLRQCHRHPFGCCDRTPLPAALVGWLLLQPHLRFGLPSTSPMDEEVDLS